MAVNEKYKSSFTSDNGVDYTIWVTTDTPYVDESIQSTYDFTLLDPGFELQYQGEGDEIFEPIKSSTLRFSYDLRSGSDNSKVNLIINNPKQNWYVTLLKDDVLDWFGYLKVENVSYNNDSPSAISLEAADPLSLLQNLRLWDARINTSDDLFYGNGDINDDLAFRFGRARKWISQGNGYEQPDTVSSPIKESYYATIIEHIWSLLYDCDPVLLSPTGSNDGPGFLSIMVGTEHFQRTGNGHAWEELYLRITQPYDDYRQEFVPKEKSEKTAAEALSYVLTLFNSRVFLSGGRYWVVQPRTYLGNPFEVYNYSPNTNPTVTTTPIRDSGPTSTIPNVSSNTIELGSNLADSLKGGSIYEYLNPLQKVKAEVWSGNGKEIKSASTGNSVALSLSSFNLQKFDLGFLDVSLSPYTVSNAPVGHTNDGDLKVATNLPIASLILSSTTIIQETLGSPIYNVIDLMVYQRMHAQNKVISKISGTIISEDYAFFQAIEHKSDVYMCNGMTRIGNLDQVRGEWIKFELEEDGITTETEESSNSANSTQRSIALTSSNGIITTSSGKAVRI